MSSLELKPIRRGRPPGTGRADIALSASLLFRERGFESTGIDQVMVSCGKTAGTFYHHFDSKEDLVMASLAEAFKHSKIFLSSYLSGCSDSKKRWKKWASFYLSPNHLKAIQKGCPIAALAGEVSKSSERVKAHFAQLTEDLLMFIDGGSHVSSKHFLALSLMTGSLAIARVLPEARRDAHLSSALETVHRFLEESWPT